MAFSPDSTIVASAGGGSWLGGGDSVIRLWRISDGRLLRRLAGHTRTVNKIVFSPDGDLLASCCSKATLLWRMPDGKCLRTLGSGAHDLAFSSDGTRLAALSRKIRTLKELWEGAETDHHLWSIPDGKDIGYNTSDELSQKADFIWEGVSPDGRMMVDAETVKIGEDEYEAIVLRTTSDYAMIREIKGKDLDPMNNTVFSADGCLLASSHTFHPMISLWRVSDGKRLAEIKWQDQGAEETSTYSYAVNSLAFAPNGKWLAAGYENDNIVRVWPIIRSSNVVSNT